jgi:DNA-binding transcriptional LysR family regulator
MTFDQLEMLHAIVTHGTFKAASMALHKSQPSLSVGIKKLEEEFGLELFNRDQYRPELTEQGRVFYRWSLNCLESFKNLEVIGKEMGQSDIEPKLTLIIDPLVQFEDIQAVFYSCLGAKSATELTIRSEILSKGMQAVLSGTADFAIGPILKTDDRLESIPFKKIDLIPVANRRIAKHYSSYPQIVVQSPDSSGELTKGAKCYVSDHDMKCKLILSGFGWGRMAKHEIEDRLKSKELIKIDDKIVRPFSLQFHIMRNRHHALGPVGKSIWSKLA